MTIDYSLKDYDLPKSACIRFSGKPISKAEAFFILLRTTSSFNRSNILFKTLEEKTKQLYNSSLKDIYNYLVDKGFILKDIPYLNNYYYENIGGVLKGICDLEGNFNQFNLVKYPSYDSVKKELDLIAKEFPFLDITATIFNEPECNDIKTPAFSFKITKGIVKDTEDHLIGLTYIYNEYENLNFNHLEMFYKLLLNESHGIFSDNFNWCLKHKHFYSLL